MKRIKKFLAVLLAAVMVLSLCNGFAVLADDTEAESANGDSENVFDSGDGTEENPYQVSTAEQLNAVRNDLDACYIQTADIDLSGIEWVPIGTYADSFNGTYDGNGYTITNMSITEVSEDIYGDQSGSGSSSFIYIGLFGWCVSSEIKNITLNCDINLDLNSYIMAYGREEFYIGGICGSYQGETLTSCVVYGNISVSNVSGAHVGGITGQTVDVYNCMNYADITVESKDYSTEGLGSASGEVFCGGITGATWSVYGDEITYCLNYGNICASGCSFLYCGGISGEYGAISLCINYGDISGSIINYRYYSTFAGNTNVGGIVGATSSITDDSCINYGNISAEGDPDGDGSSYAGGIIGFIGYYGRGNISNCYNLGQSITAETSAGRIAGELIESNASELYSLDSTLVNSGIPDESETGTTTIHGASLTEDEISVKVYDLYSEILGIEYFVIGEDTNDFAHTTGLMSSYYTDYFSELIWHVDLWSACELLVKYYDDWNGSCEGISLSMIFTSEDKLTNLFGTQNYFSLGAPTEGSTLYSVINYYQLVQYTSWYESTMCIYSGSDDINLVSDSEYYAQDISIFLYYLTQEAIQSEEEQTPFLFKYNYTEADGTKGGHSVVVCGYSQDDEGNHVIQIYDLNTYSLGSKYTYMTISSDYSSFEYTDANYVALADEWLAMQYYSIEDLADADWNLIIASDSESSTEASLTTSSIITEAVSGDDTVSISISAYQEFTLTNAEGQSLSYDGESYSGDMDIYSIKIVGEESPQLYITTDASDSFVLTAFEDDFEISVEIDGGYYTASASGADAITLSLGDGVVIEGDSYSFTGGMSVSLDSVDLVCFSGEAEGTCSISLTDSGIVLEAEGGCSDVTVETYSETEYESTDIEQDVEKITVADDEDGSTDMGITESDTHTHSYEAVVTEPTCTEQGYTTYTCSVCGDTYITDYVTATGHVYDEDYAWTWADDGLSAVKSATCTVCGEIDTEKAITAIWGSTRYTTANTVAEEAFPDGCTYAVIADGRNFPDALAAASLAGAVDGPVLVTNDNNIASTIEELNTLGVTSVYIVGGTSSVSEAVEEAIEAAGITVAERLAGSSRVETALKVAEKVLELTADDPSDTCIISTSGNYPDVLCASAYSYWASAPIYFTNTSGTSLSSATLEAIKEGGYSNVVIVGGTGSVSGDVEDAIAALGVNVTRLGGDNRYATAVLIAEWSVEQGMSYDNAAVATGTNFPDALVASALCGQKGSVLLLSNPTASKNTTLTDVLTESADKISNIYVVGGESSVSTDVRKLIADALD